MEFEVIALGLGIGVIVYQVTKAVRKHLKRERDMEEWIKEHDRMYREWDEYGK